MTGRMPGIFRWGSFPTLFWHCLIIAGLLSLLAPQLASAAITWSEHTIDAELGDPLSVYANDVAAAKADVQLPPEVSEDWWAAVQEDICKSEYNISWQEQTYLPDVAAAYHSFNRAHNLRTYFTPQGFQSIPAATDNTPEWVWGLSLTGYGAAGDIAPVAPAELSVLDNRIEYRRGIITEWYTNDERGLEQGFTLYQAPASPHEEITLRMEIGGSLQGTMDSLGEGIDFFSQDGVLVLSYGELKAVDSTGRELPGRLSLSGEYLDITIDTDGAVYPVYIDPLATSPSWTAESNQDSAQFGQSVASAGDVNGDGYSDVIIGAPKYSNGQSEEGAVFVYYGSAGGLGASGTPTNADWMAESNQVTAYFGTSVASAGDVTGTGYSDVIVGASFYDNGQFNEGGAWVYRDSSLIVPDITVSPTSKDFGPVSIGSSSSPQTITVTNDGNDDLIVGTITITGADALQYAIQNDNVSGQTIAPSANLTLEVVFSPTTAGAKSAALSIPSDDPDDNPVTITLSGIGATEAALSITLPYSSMDEGATFTMQVAIIGDITNFDATNYDVVVDTPNVLSLTNVTAGDIGGTPVPVIDFNPNPNYPGEDAWRVAQNIPSFPGVSGSGYFAVLEFTVIGNDGDTGTIRLANGIVSDNTGTEILSTWTPAGTLTIDRLEVTAIDVVGEAGTNEGHANTTTFTMTPTVSGGTGAGTYTYAWSFGTDGSGTNNVEIPSDVIYSSAGTKTIALTVTDALGQDSVGNEVTGEAIVDDILVAGFSGDTGNTEAQKGVVWYNAGTWQGTANYSSTADFDSGTTTGGTAPYTYSWDFNNDSTEDSTDANPVTFDFATFANSVGAGFTGANYTVVLTVTDSLTVSDDETKVDYITINVAGDINGDFAILADDITEIELIIALVNPETLTSDVNDDGTVNALDITATERLAT